VIVGPVLLVRSRPDVVASAGIDYNRRTGRMFNRDHGSRAAAISPANADRQAISGCVMLVAREIFDRIGLLDERYFFGFEDIEFCLRAADAGVGTRLAGRARAYHEGGRAIGPASPRRLYFAARNHLLMSATVGSGDARVVRWGRAWIIAALNIAYAVTAPGGTVTARLAATARGIGDYLRGRVGSDSGR